MERIESKSKDILHNVTLKISGPSRIVLLLSPTLKNMTFEMVGFDNVHFPPSYGEMWKEERPAYFVQFIQGINPRYVYYYVQYYQHAANLKK